MISKTEWERLKEAFYARFKAHGWECFAQTENEAYAFKKPFSCWLDYSPALGEVQGNVRHGSALGTRAYPLFRTTDAEEAFDKARRMI